MLSATSWAILQKVFTCVVLSQKCYDNIEQDFSRAMLSGQHCTRFLPVQCCPKSIKTTTNKTFPVQCFLEALGQHCTRLLSVQYCPKRSKTTLNRIFSCTMMSEAPKTTFSRVFTCAMLSQEH